MLELVEDQKVDAALIDVLEEAVDAGFTLALDDFKHAPKMDPLLDLASIVKLDVRALSPKQLEAEVRKLEPRNLTLIAEKVESAEEYELCRELGFDAYQGYFFALPELSRTPGTPTRELGTLCRSRRHRRGHLARGAREHRAPRRRPQPQAAALRQLGLRLAAAADRVAAPRGDHDRRHARSAAGACCSRSAGCATPRATCSRWRCCGRA